MRVINSVLIVFALSVCAFSQDKQWIELTAATSILVATDDYQTIHGYRETGTPWLYGTHPYQHPAKVSLIMAGETGVSALAGLYLRKHRRALWCAPQIWTATVHASGVIHNLRYGID